MKIVNSYVYKTDPLTGQQYVLLDEGPMKPDAWFDAFVNIVNTVRSRNLQGKAVVQHAWGKSISEVLTIFNDARNPVDSNVGGPLRLCFMAKVAANNTR